MMEESELFADKGVDIAPKNPFHSPVLLKTTAYARLFRLSRDGRYFVIKTTKDNSARQLELLKREYELSLGCEHPHIVNILFYEHNTPVGEGIVMQYIDGCTLQEFLATNPPVAVKRRLFSELLEAVNCLHKRGVVHNDLKPQNILVANNGSSLKLIDFGLASDDAHYLLKTPGCTTSYASPELCSGSGAVDVRSDIYSLGIIMKEMFGSSAIARRCSNAAPDKRYADVQALQKALRTRNNVYYAMAALVVLLLLILPIFHNVGEKRRAHSEEQKLNELIGQVEFGVDSICSKAIALAGEIPYQEFLWASPATMQSECAAYINKLLSTVDEPLLQAALSQRYGTVFQKHWLDIVEQLKEVTLPSCYNLPVEQVLYYDSLLKHKLPYIPFPGK